MDAAAKTELFESQSAFRHAFDRGLERLLDTGGLNLLILVTANASFDSRLFSVLRTRLKLDFDVLYKRLCDRLSRGDAIDEADDDLLVFLKIAAIGFDRLVLAEQRRAGPWEVQFNHLRSFRPLRNSQQAMTCIQAPFDAQTFNFNKGFMRDELLWSGEIAGQPFDLFYNKYPFVDLHCLLVPVREQCLPQFHRRDMHEFVWQLVQQLACTLPGIRVGYNALGAFASVNHLHYQLFIRDQPLPVEASRWVHKGGAEAYPVDCIYRQDTGSAWDLIAQLHARNQAYNLLYTPQGMYCMPRRMQGEFDLAHWSNGLSWYEMCGGMITFNHADYMQLDAPGISNALAMARLG